jgi:hypothetical protein
MDELYSLYDLDDLEKLDYDVKKRWLFFSFILW